MSGCTEFVTAEYSTNLAEYVKNIQIPCDKTFFTFEKNGVEIASWSLDQPIPHLVKQLGINGSDCSDLVQSGEWRSILLEKGRDKYQLTFVICEDDEPRVVFVGLSNKQGINAFDGKSVSGKIIRELCKRSKVDSPFFVNLVPYAPVDENGRLRYPTQEEIAKEIDGAINRVIKTCSSKVVLLGNVVQDALGEKFSDPIRIKHPAYIARNKKKMDSYVADFIKQLYGSEKIPGDNIF